MTERSYKIKHKFLRQIVDSRGGVVQVAESLGFKKQRFSHWVNGVNRVPESAFQKICVELNISGQELLDEDIKNFVISVYPRLTSVYP